MDKYTFLGVIALNKNTTAKKEEKYEKNPYFAFIFLCGLISGAFLFSFFARRNGINVFPSISDMLNNLIKNASTENIKNDGWLNFLCKRYIFDEKFLIFIFLSGFTPLSDLFSSAALLYRGVLFGYISSCFIRIIKETGDKNLVSFYAVSVISYAFIFILFISLCNRAKIFAKNIDKNAPKSVKNDDKTRYFFEFLSISGVLFAAVCAETLFYCLI